MITDDLLRVLSAHAGEPLAFAATPVPMTGGFWAKIYSFELDNPPADLAGPLVLRVMPSRDAGVREAIVQRTVAQQGYPTPEVVLDGVDEALGGAFLVMRRVEGVGLFGDVSLGRTVLQFPKMARHLAGQLSRAAVALHQLDPQPLTDRLQQAGVDVSALGVESRLGQIDAAAEAGCHGFADLAQWLRSKRPVTTPVVICHGDIHPFNMLETSDESFWLLDWTNASLCRREFDVGCTAALLNCAPIEVPTIGRAPLRVMTNSLAQRFIKAYRQHVPINLDIVEWFETLQYGRCLAEVAIAPIKNDGIVDARHPFRISAPAMIRQVVQITEVTIDLTP
ncbi:MAG TPA: phosphotransferase [Ilumatobacteraceae bacterium]|nr:phosphotransferase [Ilumatobacteraceae bacterium]